MRKNVGTRIYNDDDMTLYICDDSDRACFNCVDCPCLEAHTIDECEGRKLGCDTCRPIDQLVVEEIEEELHELYPVVIMDEMPLRYGSISPKIAAQKTADILRRAMPHLCSKFHNN